MTDNEIIKALNTALGMEHVSIYCANIKNEVHTVKVLDVIDLINRLQAEINRKEKVFIETLRRCALKDEIISEKTADIERLKAENEKLQEMLQNLYTAVPIGNNKKYANELQKIKAEAYKECIEKVKEEIYSQPHSRSLEASVERARIIKIFDNILKEWVGTNFTQMFMNVDKLNPIPNNEKEMVGEDNA